MTGTGGSFQLQGVRPVDRCPAEDRGDERQNTDPGSVRRLLLVSTQHAEKSCMNDDKFLRGGSGCKLIYTTHVTNVCL